MRARRLFLALAAAWDLAAGAALLAVPAGRAGIGVTVPAGRARAIGGLILGFGALYAGLAIRPFRPLILVSAGAKALGGANGVVGLLRGGRDAVTLVSLADLAWLPGFVLASRRGSGSRD